MLAEVPAPEVKEALKAKLVEATAQKMLAVAFFVISSNIRGIGLFLSLVWDFGMMDGNTVRFKASMVQPMISACLLLVLVLGIAGCASGPSLGDRRVLIAGDSTAANNGLATAPQTGWGQAIGFFLSHGVSVSNHAKNGRSTKSFRDEGRWTKLLTELQPGDVVVISFGHNDQKQHDSARFASPDGAYRENLIRFAKDVRSKGGTPIILSPVIRRKWRDGALVNTHSTYPAAARDAASVAGAGFVPLSSLSRAYFNRRGEEGSKTDFLWLEPDTQYPAFSGGITDNTHFSERGACAVANLIARALAGMPELSGFVRPDGGMLGKGDARSISRCAQWVADRRQRLLAPGLL